MKKISYSRWEIIFKNNTYFLWQNNVHRFWADLGYITRWLKKNVNDSDDLFFKGFGNQTIRVKGRKFLEIGLKVLETQDTECK